MLRKKFPLVQLLGCLLKVCQVCSEWHDGSGPWVIATQGEPWPLPMYRNKFEEFYIIRQPNFNFQIKGEKCDILEQAVQRYSDIIFNECIVADKLSMYKERQWDDYDHNIYAGELNGVNIYLKSPCERYPHLRMNESYDLQIPDHSGNMASMTSESIWGILRGLETFSQLVYPTADGLFIRKQTITDFPRLMHRGLLLDTSRHYIPVKDILLTLDAMSYNKLNVFHWHIVDDNSFPYRSNQYPELSRKGAYHPILIYTLKDIKKIIEYARVRGIRVIPEFDTPGHTKSWGLSHPEFLTMCYDKDGLPTGSLGPINPTNEDFYHFFATLFSEIRQVFPDSYVHIGGDEVPYDCWKSNPDINKYMEKNNFSRAYEKLEELHYNRIIRALGIKKHPIVWQEVFENVDPLQTGTVVQIWSGDWQEKISSVTREELRAILSTCWYLDHLASGGDWINFYKCDPLDFQQVVPQQKSFVLGGEACMWGEFVDRNNIHPRIWPRASATAEKLWSDRKQKLTKVKQRLEEHACRMNRRRIPAQPPNGPGFCITLNT